MPALVKHEVPRSASVPWQHEHLRHALCQYRSNAWRRNLSTIFEPQPAQQRLVFPPPGEKCCCCCCGCCCIIGWCIIPPPIMASWEGFIMLPWWWPAGQQSEEGAKYGDSVVADGEFRFLRMGTRLAEEERAHTLLTNWKPIPPIMEEVNEVSLAS